jgi:hypothetical protein
VRLPASYRTVFRTASWALLGVGVVVLVRDLNLYERLTVWRELDEIWSHEPPRSTAPFWRYKEAIVTLPRDEALVRLIEGVLGAAFDAGSVREYHAIPLPDYLRLRGEEIGSGTYLTITNIRGESVYLTLESVERERPVIVIGLDDERELFKLYFHYRLNREYSWQDPKGAMPWMTRPLGAFLYYPYAPAPGSGPTPRSHTALQPEGFVLSKEDPLAAVRDIPGPVAEILFGSRDGCLRCHSFRSSGAHSHHIRGSTGEPAGGFALPLESYEPEVMRRFLFDQASVARELGVIPNEMARSTAELLWQIGSNRQER